MVVKIPSLKSNYSGFSSLARIANSTKERFSDFTDEVHVDFSEANWIDANMTAALGVILSPIEYDNTVSLMNLKPAVEDIFLRNNFLARHGHSKADVHGTTIPYQSFNSEDAEPFAYYLKTYFYRKEIPKMSKLLEERFKRNILEIFENAATHSETKFGIFVCGQFFPKQHRLTFCVADAGIGFRQKIYKELGLILNSDTAIRWALEDRNTTRKGNVPSGLGLKLLREFAKLNGGLLQIVSDRGYWECGGNGETISRFDESFPGTVVNLEINTADTSSYSLSMENKSDNLS